MSSCTQLSIFDSSPTSAYSFESNSALFSSKSVDLPDDMFGLYSSLAKQAITIYKDILTNEGDSEEFTVAKLSDTSKYAQFIIRNRSGSLTIFPKTLNGITLDTLDMVIPDEFYHRHLKMLDFKNNHYKYYTLEALDGSPDKIQASWGRIGESPSKAKRPYDFKTAALKFGEKLAKGYTDFTELYYDDELSEKELNTLLENGSSKRIVKNESNTKDNSEVSQELYNKLLAFAKHTVKSLYRGVENYKPKITKKMIAECERLFVELQKCESVDVFNEVLQKLMCTADRPIRKNDDVNRYSANCIEDFSSIIDREEAILNSFKIIRADKDKEVKVVEGFDQSIHVVKASKEEVEEVKKHLNHQRSSQIVNVYRVTNDRTKNRYKSYCEKKHIDNKKMLWHGSRNENWLSIISTGLSLNPNAVITGKMFGNGIYFATDCDKSWGYTSGGRWNREYSDTRIMGLYETAYGHPKELYGGAERYTQKMLESEGKDSVHAKGRDNGGKVLHADEIVYYNEGAVDLKYVVEFDGGR